MQLNVNVAEALCGRQLVKPSATGDRAGFGLILCELILVNGLCMLVRSSLS